MSAPPTPHLPPPLGARILMGVFGFAFAGIGLTIIISLWSASGFGEPPLVFKLVGSFISLTFIIMGGVMAISMIKGKGIAGSRRFLKGSLPEASRKDYTCSNCGATLKKGTEVSPLGDVKCSYCGNWFNVHQSSRS